MATGTSRNILITVDDSPASERVFGYALQNFYRPGDVLHILHILPPSRQVVVTPDLGLEGVLEDNEDTRRKVDDHARQFLKDKFETKLETLKVGCSLVSNSSGSSTRIFHSTGHGIGLPFKVLSAGCVGYSG
eukprot:GHRR01018776.1.p1 GENE.GHRR01018776.1~~GHRR01018776.1.p1  ORF type:complete len:132 (+),score=24.45 GHRR01018776.1:210-605(+)